MRLVEGGRMAQQRRNRSSQHDSHRRQKILYSTPLASNLYYFVSITFDFPVPARPPDHHQSIQHAPKPLYLCCFHVIGRSGDLVKPRSSLRSRRGYSLDGRGVASCGMLQRPSTHKPSLSPLRVHHRHPLGSVHGSQSCKGMHVWSERGGL